MAVMCSVMTAPEALGATSESRADPRLGAAAGVLRVAQEEAEGRRGSSEPTIDLRPGAFVAPSNRPSWADDSELIEGEGFSATYVDADVALVVNQIVGGFLGLDYTIAPDVNGEVTLRVSDVRTRGQALGALRTALAPLGVAVVERNDFVAIVRGSGDGAAGNIVVIAPGEPPPAGASAAVLVPRYIAASVAAELVAPFVPPSTVALTDDEHGFLILRGEEAAIASASEAVALFDVDWFSQISTGVFPLTHVSPEELADEIAPLLGPAIGEVELISAPRLSSLIVLARDPGALSAVRSWVERLDVAPVRTATGGLLVYDARYADAAMLADAVGRLMGAGATGVRAEEPSLASRSGSQLSPSNVFDGGLQQPGANGGPLLQPSPALGRRPGPRGDAGFTLPPSGGSGAAAAPLIVTAVPEQNAVIARGEEAQIAEVRALLEALDRPRAQVLIEATIVEVTLNDELRYGVNWSGIEDGRLGGVFSDAPDGAVTSRFPGLSVFYVNTDIEAALNALSSVTNIEIVSRPSVIALHDEAAALQIGDQVPIVTQSAVSVIEPNAPIVNQTTYRDTGVLLTVIPHVRAGGTVEIEVAQEVSDVARTTTSGIDSPTITQRRIESTLLVPSGESVALGGLISTARSTGEVGVPILKNAPLVGGLFRTNSNIVERTELIVFLTPRVLGDPREAVDATVQMRAALTRLEAVLAEP